MQRAHQRDGISVLEFLVVISIITLLSGVLMLAFRDPKKGARDVRRITDLKELSKALSLYEAEHRSYPAAAALMAITGADTLSQALTGSGVLQKPIIDPLMPTFEYRYQTNSNATNYHVQFCLETDRIEGYAIGCGNVYTP
jgi:type II secretory pathway pseudopilin PulG